jgi:uncharacterized protein (TIGR03435 family)
MHRKLYTREFPLVLASLLFAAGPGASSQANQRQATTSQQATKPDLSFEVATIKPSNPTTDADGMQSDGHRFTVRNAKLAYLMSFAYDIQSRQIVGGPAWMMTDKYDIAAVTPEQTDGRQLKGMVRKLLAERFGLSFHREKRTLPAYVLVLDKADAKMEKSEADANSGSSFRGRGMVRLTVTNGSMPDFARWLNSGILDRPVIDETGLTGKFNFTLNWTPDDSRYGGMGSRTPPPTDNASALPGFFTAIKEQTGLKMDATKVDVDVLVIDHVEKPAEN